MLHLHLNRLHLFCRAAQLPVQPGQKADRDQTVQTGLGQAVEPAPDKGRTLRTEQQRTVVRQPQGHPDLTIWQRLAAKGQFPTVTLIPLHQQTATDPQGQPVSLRLRLRKQSNGRRPSSRNEIPSDATFGWINPQVIRLIAFR